MSARTCGECTMCCKTERVIELDKPPNTWCDKCLIGKGCSIYESRPRVCRTFECIWLKSPDIPDTLRPDRIGMYGVAHNGYVKLVADPDWQGFGWGSHMLAMLTNGQHAILVSGDSMQFICGEKEERPQRLMIDWVL